MNKKKANHTKKINKISMKAKITRSKMLKIMKIKIKKMRIMKKKKLNLKIYDVKILLSLKRYNFDEYQYLIF